MKDKVKILLVGIGGYGAGYLNALLDTKDERYVIEGLVEPYPNSSARYPEAKERGIPLYNTMTEFYAEHDADLAVISTPIHFHTPMIIEALENGSNVLCEKPLCGDDKDIDKLIAARDKAGKFVSIGYQLSHSKAVLDFKRDILAGDFGKPEMLKTLVLWPRDHAYYGRGIGWAGKMLSKDGAVIRDSVANNATAHYLFNMFYVLGPTIDSALMPVKIETVANKANNIESFDSAEIYATFEDGSQAIYLGTHAVTKTRGPEFIYRFEKGTAHLSTYNGKNQIHAFMNDGTVREYGSPFDDSIHKLFVAADAILDGKPNVTCGIEAAAVQTRIIAAVHEQHPEIKRFPDALVAEYDNGQKVFTYCKGLQEKYEALYDIL